MCNVSNCIIVLHPYCSRPFRPYISSHSKSNYLEIGNFQEFRKYEYFSTKKYA